MVHHGLEPRQWAVYMVVQAAVERTHILNWKQEVDKEQTQKLHGFKLSKPTSNGILPPTWPHLLRLSKQCHQPETKHSNAKDYIYHLNYKTFHGFRFHLRTSFFTSLPLF